MANLHRIFAATLFFLLSFFVSSRSLFVSSYLGRVMPKGEHYDSDNSDIKLQKILV